MTWEVDEFHGDNAGLVVAELELDTRGRRVFAPAVARRRGHGAAPLLQRLPRHASLSRMDRRRTEPVSLRVSLAAQTLALVRGGAVAKTYAVSTSKHGAGEMHGSFKTPRGRHVVRAKIGAGAPLNAVFRGRRPTGEIYSAELARAHPDRDWILTRILWLSGHRNRQEPARASRYNAPLHLYPWRAGYGAARRARLDRLHSHGERRRGRAVRSRSRRNGRGHRLTGELGDVVSLGPLMIDLRGKTLAADEREWLAVAARRRRHPVHAQLRERRAARAARRRDPCRSSAAVARDRRSGRRARAAVPRAVLPAAAVPRAGTALRRGARARAPRPPAPAVGSWRPSCAPSAST